MSEELKACPYCDSAAEVDRITLGVNVYCPNEECSVIPETGYCDSREEAVELWNKRPGEEALLVALRDCRKWLLAFAQGTGNLEAVQMTDRFELFDKAIAKAEGIKHVGRVMQESGHDGHDTECDPVCEGTR